MTQVENFGVEPGDIAKYHIGSVISSANGAPVDNTINGWYNMVKGFQDEALGTRLAIPIIYGIDAIHGHGQLLGATIFPHNIGLGAANDADLVQKIGRATALETMATGIQWNFSPVVAVVHDIRWGRTYESFGEDTDLVQKLGEAAVRGLSSVNNLERIADHHQIFLLSTAKHFIGDGATSWGSSEQNIKCTMANGNKVDKVYMLDQGDSQLDVNTLRQRLLPPYSAAIRAGAMSVMASFSSWNGQRMHAHKELLTDELKDRMGFEGLVISDWDGIEELRKTPKGQERDRTAYYHSCVDAINAGVDMAMLAKDWLLHIDVMKEAVQKGDIPMERVDDAVRRILRVKIMAGLFERPMPDASLRQHVRSPAHVQLAREAVGKSLVLLQNDRSALPIAATARIVLAGRGADNIGMQCGGWFIRWQGMLGKVTPAVRMPHNKWGNAGRPTGGTSILDAFRKHMKSDVDYVVGLPDNSKRWEVAVVVIGEEPYAEGMGDEPNPTLTEGDVAALAAMRPRADKVVAVILSGRPLIIANHLHLADAWVAAWLPGTEGEGVTDVLLGTHPFQGRTSVTWPQSADQLPLNKHNTWQGQALFPFGHGLSL
uniref:beta-glucosidase n=1 Tax=Eutreptiella gymnastica TaxID=73025 RepID=A0A7S1IGX3_9EUGL